jgi:hypothetical protein
VGTADGLRKALGNCATGMIVVAEGEHLCGNSKLVHRGVARPPLLRFWIDRARASSEVFRNATLSINVLNAAQKLCPGALLPRAKKSG